MQNRYVSAFGFTDFLVVVLTVISGLEGASGYKEHHPKLALEIHK